MEKEIDEEKVDEAVLALLYLTTFKDKPYWRAWKGHNWEADPQREGIFTPASGALSPRYLEER
jgi:hypothetical protein